MPSRLAMPNEPTSSGGPKSGPAGTRRQKSCAKFWKEGRPTQQRVQVCNQRNRERHIQHGAKPIRGPVYAIEEECCELLAMHGIGQGYLVTETVRMGKLQTIALPPPIDTSASDTEDQKIIHKEVVRAIAKRKAKLDSALKKGYTTV